MDVLTHLVDLLHFVERVSVIAESKTKAVVHDTIGALGSLLNIHVEGNVVSPTVDKPLPGARGVVQGMPTVLQLLDLLRQAIKNGSVKAIFVEGDYILTIEVGKP
jgi:hypothetical protein